ncbi:hypothetical protein BRC75_02310 [Halobacteriales archaeon QH_7_69_31]|nr:MAG: hypothetical protein BRC75_02310 [Halobacteriales archaeon QH_7_69_31]
MDRERVWLLLPSPVRNLPADLAAVLAVVALTNLAVFLPVVNDSPVRVVVGLVFVLFVPGYAFIAALFPEAGEPPTTAGPGAAAGPDDARSASAADDEESVGDEESDGESASPTDDEESAAHAEAGAVDTNADGNGNGLGDRGIDGIERTALSFGLSIAVVPLIGLALNFTPFGIRLVPILVTISLFTVLASVLAALRRWELPASERFRVPYREWYADGRSEVTDPDSTLDAALNVALVVAILLATTSVVYAVAVPQQGEQFTEFYVLTEEEDGDLVTAGYPETLSPNESTPVHVGVENNEYEPVEYTVVVQLQAVDIEDNRSTVTDRARLDRYSVTIAHNETDIRERPLELDAGTAREFAGQDRRVKFLLYRGDPPADPTADEADHHLHFWVEVTDESGS